MNSIRASLRHPQFRTGVRDMASVSLGIAAWGLVTGVAMVKSGLSVPLALLMTFTVFAGSAQLAALPLMATGAPLWVIWATAFCVNLRFVIFSAQWRPFFMRFPLRQRLALGYVSGDLSYVLFMKRFQEAREDQGQIEYFFGGSALNWLSWQGASVVGILLADVIPTQWGLGFAGVLALLGLACSLLSDRATGIAALVAGAAAVAAFALPFKLNILVAIAAAVCVGLLIDGGGGDAGRRARDALLRAAQRLGPAVDGWVAAPARGVRMNSWETLVAIAGLAVITVGTRGFFLISERELVLPEWMQRGLKYAPLAALAAVVAPEVVMSQGQFIDTWKDARLFAVAAATGYFCWRRGILGTILTGMAVLIPLKLGLGW